MCQGQSSRACLINKINMINIDIRITRKKKFLIGKFFLDIFQLIPIVNQNRVLELWQTGLRKKYQGGYIFP
jgi:hypothetical protein